MIEAIPLAEAGELPSGADMPGELLAALGRKEGLYALRQYGAPVGLALAEQDEAAFLCVYIFPAFRRRGLGGASVRLFEDRLKAGGAKTVMTAYAARDAGLAAFADKLGYRRRFSSALMAFRGERPDTGALPARGYRDEDYGPAHALYAQAFHEMRLGTGDFPDSVLEPPSEKQRREWAESAEERYVFLHEGGIAGYAHIENDLLCSVAVSPALQRRGIGRRFVQYLCGRIMDEGWPEPRLFCLAGNGARSLYDALGFVELRLDDYAKKPL